MPNINICVAHVTLFQQAHTLNYTNSANVLRRYENIRAEVEAFFDVHEELGTVPGGIHLEMTGDNVTGQPCFNRQAFTQYTHHCVTYPETAHAVRHASCLLKLMNRYSVGACLLHVLKDLHSVETRCTVPTQCRDDVSKLT